MDLDAVVRDNKRKLDNAVTSDKHIAELYQKITDGTASYADADEFASISGGHAGDILLESLLEVYPNGSVPEAAALQVLPPELQQNYDYVSNYAKEVQKILNEKAGIGLAPVVPDFDRDRANGLATEISRLSDLSQYTDKFKNQVENDALSVVDEAVKQNAKAHSLVGLKPTVVRTYDNVGLHNGKDVCEFCSSLQGSWTYDEAISRGVFARHAGCNCEIAFITARRTDVQSDWTRNEWTQVLNSDKIEARRQYGLTNVVNRSTGEKVRFVEGAKPIYPRDHLIASGKNIRMIDEFLRIGGSVEDWKHQKAYFEVYTPYGTIEYAEIHWYECRGVSGRYLQILQTHNGNPYFDDIDEWEKETQK